jgi:hypothetical protein
VLAGDDPQQPPAADEVRYHVTEHFTVLGPSTLWLNNSQQLQGLNVQHMIHSVTVTEGVGEQETSRQTLSSFWQRAWAG